jgi:thiamine biosynthesis lipoprotein
MWGVLSAAQLVSERSHGAFDITVGSLVRLWGFHDKTPHIPTDVELQRVRPLVGYDNLVLNREAQTVSFKRPGVELDLGGIAKGFAVELAGGVLRRRAFAGFIDAGGNQFFVGHPVGKPSWRVGIDDPDTPSTRVLGVLDVEGGAVSTSGGYHNFFVANGKRYGHLLDPRTLRPSEGALSVTIVSPDATMSDALSKPAFILGPVAGLQLVESFGAMALIASRSADGGIAIAMSSPLKARFHRTTE